jgi:hypothetical protein
MKATRLFQIALPALCSVFFLVQSGSCEDAAAEVKKTNYAVMAIKNGDGVSAGEAEVIADRLRTELFRTGRVNMMERDQMQEILKEQGFQASGACTDEACMVEIGQLLGVERLVSGSIGKLGSMFLVNLRTIDVRTAKILMVVSVDIKGGIEDVVDELPDIAKQLVGENESKRIVSEAKKPVKVEEPEPEPEEVKEPEKVEEKQAAEPEEEEEEEDDDDDKPVDKNENLGGVRLAFNLISSKVAHSGTWRTDVYGDTLHHFKYSSGDSDNVNVFINPQVKFIIPAGRFITIDVGPGLIYGNEEYYLGEEYTNRYNYIYTYVIPDISTGVNFVMRFFPLKINAGVTFDFLIPIISKRDEYAEMQADTISYYTYFPEVGIGFAVAPGGRVGLEILPSPKIGIGVEMVFRPISFTVTSERTDTDYTTYNTTDITTKETYTFRPFQLGLSVSFYH